jgi:hypothetical protein
MDREKYQALEWWIATALVAGAFVAGLIGGLPSLF